jgi:hypothetical protein
MNGCQESPTSEGAQNANLITLIENGLLKTISLTQGKIALVDPEDYDWLSQWKWYASERGYTYYAMRCPWIDKRPNPIFMHREILGLKKGDKTIGDHRDRNGLHNWRQNLRVVTPSISMCNRKRNKNNTSGFKGVSWNKNAQKWIVHIGFHGKDIYCGLYSDPIMAAQVYDAEAKRYFKEDAVLNFP